MPHDDACRRRIHADAAGTSCNDNTNNTVTPLLGAKRDPTSQVVRRRNGKPQGSGRPGEPLVMLIERERGPVIRSDGLEAAVAPQDSAVEH
jgi:hypothetical protein